MINTIKAAFALCCLFPAFGLFRLLKRLVCLYVGWRHPDLGPPLEELGVLCTVPDRKLGYPPSAVLTILNLKGHLDLPALRTSFLERVIGKKDSQTGSPSNPQLQQYLTQHMGYYFWKSDPNFRIENHIQLASSAQKFKDSISDLLFRDFEKGKSPWEILIRYDVHLGGSPCDKPCTCLILRFHHSIGDGKSFIKLLFQDFCGIPMPEPQQPDSTVPKSSLCDWVHFIHSLSRASEPKSIWTEERGNYALGVDWSVSQPIPLLLLKETAKERGTTLPVLVLSALVMSLRQELLKSNSEIPPFLTCTVPVPVPRRTHPENLTNHFSVRLVNLPLGLSSLDEIIQNLSESFIQADRQNILCTSYKFTEFIGSLPSYLMKSTVAFSGNFSNFAGPSQPATWQGHLVKSLHLFGLGSTDMGLNSYAVSYNGDMSIYVGLNNRLRGIYKTSSTLILENMMEIIQGKRGFAEFHSNLLIGRMK